MKGTWSGIYQHESKLIPENIRKQITKFKIEIEYFDGKNFEGKIEDDISTGGTGGTGIVAGKKINNKITFIKKMPVETILLPDGSIRTSNKKHPPIYYSGIISADEKEIKGSWKFKFGIILIGFIPALRAPIKGSWSMEKLETL